MSFKILCLATAVAVSISLPALAGSITVQEPYARASGESASSGAAFMVLKNHGEADDRLLSVTSEAAKKVALHTHSEGANGVMKMHHLAEGAVIPAGGMHALERGGDHVMFMGLIAPMKQGDKVLVTLMFENAGAVTVTVPVDLKRAPKKHKMKP